MSGLYQRRLHQWHQHFVLATFIYYFIFTVVATHVSSFNVMSCVYVQSDLMSPLFSVVLYCPV